MTDDYREALEVERHQERKHRQTLAGRYEAMVDWVDAERKRYKEEGPMELATIDETEEIVLFTGDPAARMQQMAETAAIIAEPVRARHTVTISGRQHVRVEGWTMLGALLGVHPYLVWSRPCTDSNGDGGPGWEARVEARTRTGDVVGSAEAMCTRTEKTWAGRDDYALRSMAQTRATSKAMRQPLGFIITLAGFDATPAEEMAVADSSFRAPTVDKTITEPQQKKVYALRDKLTKAGVFTIEAFDTSLQNLYGTNRVNELTREQARELIDRLEAVEPT